MSATAASGQKGFKRNEKKWTPTLMNAGWSLLPDVFLEHQKALGLDPIDVNIILHLVRHWWYPGELPFPSKRTIATCMQIDVSTVRRRIKKLEVAGYVRRVPRHDLRYGQKSNEYDLSGMIEAARPFAEQMLKEREENKAKRSRRRDQLRVIAG